MKSFLQVLIVDDDRNFGLESTRIIKEHGITTYVKTALNGGHALLYLNQIYTQLNENKLLILLDTEMPIMDGIEFLKHYDKCAYPNKENIQIAIILTPSTKKEDILFAREMGICHFVEKPLCGETLNRIVESGNARLEKVA